MCKKSHVKKLTVYTRLEQVCANVNFLSIATLKDKVSPRWQEENAMHQISVIESCNEYNLRYFLHLFVVS